MYFLSDDTICAPATVPGSGAISVIRVSGPEALHLVSGLVECAPGREVSAAPGYSARFGRFFLDDGSLLDEVVVTVFRAPHSYTGEDSVEISCHASKYIVDNIMLQLIEAGARAAAPGEFTRRAFLNGKMDLAQAEAVADLIAAENAGAHRVALNQLKGGFSSQLKRMRGELLNIVSLMELELDFSEEDVEFADRGELHTLLDSVLEHISGLISSFKLGNAIKNGIPVAIAGATNTGKSTLLNALLGEERAIVSDVHGTTRDTVEEVMNVGGLQFRFIDTAGLRKTSETVELIGIERTLQKMQQAEVILGVVDTSRSSEEVSQAIEEIMTLYKPEQQKLILILNKADLLGEVGQVGAHGGIGPVGQKIAELVPEGIPQVLISAKLGDGIDSLKQVLVDVCGDYRVETDAVMVTNLRHVEALANARESLLRVREGLSASIPTDLVAQDLREALYHLGSIVGEISTDEVLGSVFRNFCIGK